jgi:cobalt-zinc-cadmium efflux system protein
MDLKLGYFMKDKLKYALILSLINFTIEIIAGVLTSSLALLSDAVHIFTDVIALVISLLAMNIGQRATDALRTYGYRRFEIIAAMTNALLLFFAALFILYHGYQRLFHLPEIKSGAMLIVAIIGMIINLISTRILFSESQNNLNIKAAYIDSLADLISSVGVIIAAIVIRYTGWSKIDPIIAMLIGIWILPRCWKLLCESINILLEGVPKGISLELLIAEFKTIPGVIDVHDLHVWSITSNLNSLTAHLVVDTYPQDNMLIYQAINIAKKHGINHTNFQIELESSNLNGFTCKHEH